MAIFALQTAKIKWDKKKADIVNCLEQAEYHFQNTDR